MDSGDVAGEVEVGVTVVTVAMVAMGGEGRGSPMELMAVVGIMTDTDTGPVRALAQGVQGTGNPVLPVLSLP